MSQADEIRDLRRRVEQLESQKRGWSEYRELVLRELNRLQDWLEGLSTTTNGMETVFVERIANLRAALTREFGEDLDPLKTKVNENSKEIAKLTVKAGVWGAIAGLIPVFALFVWWLLKGD